ncbi:MAG TPA: hypothetical protein VIP11_01120 [Gemmatimonadaceae bacterium]
MMRNRAAIIVAFGAVTYFAARGIATWATSSNRWMRIARDSSYDIAIDTTRMSKRYGQWDVVLYRTDHARTQLYKGKPFDREVVESVIRCDSLWFKIASIDLSLGSHRPISRQRADDRDLFDQPWRRVERGTIEERVARAACDLTRTYATGSR